MKAALSRVLLVVSLIGFVLATPALSQETRSEASPSPVPAGTRRAEPRAPDLLHELNNSLKALASKVSPAVAQVQVSVLRPQEEKDDDGAVLIARGRAIGAGVIVDPDGYIMTNAHVVEGAQRIRVILPAPVGDSPLDMTAESERQILDAKLVGVHKETDLALLKVEGHDLPTLPLGTNRPVHPGEMVFAVGSPEGLRNSVTMGVVSSVWRQPDPDQPMVYIQTDAPINPGNSGGPLVDLDGYVVGLNTFTLSKSGGSEGLGFAIPARIVGFVYQELRKYGHVHRTEIQAHAQAITPTLAAGLGLTHNWGVVVSDVTPDGPAEAAGLKVGDVVVAADGRPIMGLPGFAAALYLHPTDQVLELDILRGSQKLSLQVHALEHRDNIDQLADLADPKRLIGKLGVFTVEFDDDLQSLLQDVRIPSGVVVIGEAAAVNSLTSGLHVGDIIHGVNRTAIESVEELRSAIEKLKPGDPVVLQIERGGKLQYLAFDME